MNWRCRQRMHAERIERHVRVALLERRAARVLLLTETCRSVSLASLRADSLEFLQCARSRTDTIDSIKQSAVHSTVALAGDQRGPRLALTDSEDDECVHVVPAIATPPTLGSLCRAAWRSSRANDETLALLPSQLLAFIDYEEHQSEH